ncbi:hypothetical protein SAMN05660297_02852 [Natronincola peptidivorans]|uniref:Uncharacterized protein n=1 Tax=Natronincola peptidivorans TaxID=426128 RepID=A0A1I0FNF5_9FIRM|nr:hypothetical protein [Natronincola peptidivorans]SET59041.1 hypothetical protein SAMN05660297_02852 [Natronincola peptidivorans]
MKKKLYTWEKEASLGSPILQSNNRKLRYNVIFAGAEKLEDSMHHRVHFIYTFFPTSPSMDYGCGLTFSSNITITAIPGEIVRFANHLGIMEEVTVTYRPEDYGSYHRFFPIKHMKLLEIEKDYLRYKIHCE